MEGMLSGPLDAFTAIMQSPHMGMGWSGVGLEVDLKSFREIDDFCQGSLSTFMLTLAWTALPKRMILLNQETDTSDSLWPRW